MKYQVFRANIVAEYTLNFIKIKVMIMDNRLINIPDLMLNRN